MRMSRRGSFVAVVGLFALLGAVAGAQSLPALTAPVNDFAHVIDAASAQELDRRIRALETGTPTHDTVVVATVDSYAPYGSIEEYALRLFERAGIGQKGTDNGVLIVLAVKERRVRIEVGYGLEEFITDGFSGDTIRQAMLPAFREGQYGPGFVAGATRIIQRIAERRGVTLADVPAAAAVEQDRPGFPIAMVVIVLIVILVIVLHISSRLSGPPRFGGRRRGGWSGWHGGVGGFGGFGGLGGGFGGGRGGGFGGFGGGRSGGGGASGGW
jgi:uncharacterized protein